uniref:Uncharacterized protein LOC104231914 n=1 Tax=Nicotiana sylvestris TaxID=4096 RepID=A0A1U7X8M2_NICSY|nr:PREDICTED: uncharacterized protein LOC104231914 [Nicotiana sylvestris]
MACQIVSSLAFQRLYSFSSDYSLLTKGSGSSLVILVVYVDAILLTGVDVSDISSLKRKFFHDLLAEFHSSNCSPVTYPLELNVKSKAKDEEPLPRPEQPCVPHIKATMHLLRYLKGNSDFGIFFSHSSDLSLQAYYYDSDCGFYPDSRRSVSGLLSDLGVLYVPPVPLFCDGLFSIHNARNPVFYERPKYIKLDCHFVQSKLVEGLITLSHNSSASQLGDVFTKALSSPVHHLHIIKLGVLSPSNLRKAAGIIDMG